MLHLNFFMSIYADKALEKYNITYREVEKLWDEGYIKVDKKKKFWTEIYTFDSEDEYEDWKKWCIKKAGEKSFTNIDLLYCLGQPYLFKEKIIQNDDNY